MADVADLTVPITLRKRPFLVRVVRFPFVAHQHFRVMRRYGNGWLLSVCAAWILASYTVQIGTQKPQPLRVR